LVTTYTNDAAAGCATGKEFISLVYGSGKCFKTLAADKTAASFMTTCSGAVVGTLKNVRYSAAACSGTAVLTNETNSACRITFSDSTSKAWCADNIVPFLKTDNIVATIYGYDNAACSTNNNGVLVSTTYVYNHCNKLSALSSYKASCATNQLSYTAYLSADCTGTGIITQIGNSTCANVEGTAVISFGQHATTTCGYKSFSFKNSLSLFALLLFFIAIF
jgi:hypothetical protein